MTSLVRPAMASVAVRTTSVAVRARRVTPVAFVDRSPSTTVTRGAGPSLSSRSAADRAQPRGTGRSR